MKSAITIIATTLGLGLLGNAGAEPVNAAGGDALSIVETTTNTMREAISRRDLDQLMQTYAETAVLLPPTDETLADPRLIRRFWLEQADSMQNIDVDWVRCERQGNTIYSAGVWSATAMTDEGTAAIGGNLVNVFTRSDDGSWKTTLQTWN